MMIFSISLENAQSDAFSTENVMTDAEGREVHGLRQFPFRQSGGLDSPGRPGKGDWGGCGIHCGAEPEQHEAEGREVRKAEVPCVFPA